MNFTIENGTLIFEGILDETCKVQDCLSAFEQAKSEGLEPPLKVDLSKVRRSNSTGIVVWLKFMRAAECSFEYVNCPIWLVNQFNMIDQFFNNNSTVTSFQAPYYNEATDATRVVTLVVGKDIEKLESYDSYVMENRTIDGEDYEPDFNPSRYFSFLAEDS